MATRKKTPAAAPRSAAFGSSNTRFERQWLTATVIDHDAEKQTYRLSIDGVGFCESAPRLMRDPGDLSVLPPDTLVVVHNALGYWVIDAVLKQAPVTPTTMPPFNVTEVRGIGGEDPVRGTQTNRPSARPQTDPVDVVSGDWVRVGPDGNLMGVLRGGVNVMKSGAFAQIRTHLLEQLVEVFAHQYRHLSAMGNLEIKTVDGKTSLTWRAGADQQEENGPDRENWTIRLDVGAAGDLFDLRVTTPGGQLLSRIHLDSHGKVQIIGSQGVDVVSGGTPDTMTHETVTSSRTTSVGGSHNVRVGRDATRVVAGNDTTRVSGNAAASVGNAATRSVGGDTNDFIGGTAFTRVLGGQGRGPGAAAVEVVTGKGGFAFIAGDPFSGGSVLDASSFLVQAHSGGVHFALEPGAVDGFNVLSQLPGGVKLGATGTVVQDPVTGSRTVVATAPFGVMKHEPFAVLMQALLVWLDTHVHLSAVGPTSPSPVPASPVIAPLIDPIRSVRVAVGL